METIEYKNLEWYVIKETDKEKLLFLRDSFTNEQISKYFTDKTMVDKYFDVRYSKIYTPWYKSSYIREVLNNSFLEDLDKNDLNIMRTTLTLRDKTSTTEDYVRLITAKEVVKLPKDVLKTEREYGYWTMSPHYFSGRRSDVFVVCGSNISDYLYDYGVSVARAVRPVISLKPEILKSEVSLESDEIQKAILKFRKVTKC